MPLAETGKRGDSAAEKAADRACKALLRRTELMVNKQTDRAWELGCVFRRWPYDAESAPGG